MGLCLALACAIPAQAQELTAEQIVQKATDRSGMGIRAGSAQITMTLQSKSGEKRERKIQTRVRSDDGLHRSLIRFLAPADVQGTAFLLVEKGGGESDDMFLYLPALKRTRRIAGSQKNGSFMGSDFTYADMESRDVKNATYDKLADDTIDGNACYHIAAKPKSTDDQYSKIELWVRKDNFLPQQIKFYKDQSEPLKIFKLYEAKQIDGDWIATKTQMWNKQEGTSTFLLIDNVDTKTAIDPAELTPDNLSKG
jgi:outer membrane lipoprotein-sorting protein